MINTVLRGPAALESAATRNRAHDSLFGQHRRIRPDSTSELVPTKALYEPSLDLKLGRRGREEGALTR